MDNRRGRRAQAEWLLEVEVAKMFDASVLSFRVGPRFIVEPKTRCQVTLLSIVNSAVSDF
jgi:hypothetical protein